MSDHPETGTEPRVSVIVPVLNGARTLDALLSALRTQAPLESGSVEILIVDNGSSDGSMDIIAGSGINGLRLLSEPKRGPSAARNRGLSEARGDLIALLDADCVPTRRWLRELIEPFRDDNVLLVAGGLASFPPRTAAQRFAARYGLNEADRMVETRVMPFANTRNMAVRRHAAQAVGGWPEDMTHGEDVEFSYRIRERFGCGIEYRPTAIALHQDRETDDELWGQAYGYGRSMAHLYARHPDLLPWTWREEAQRRWRSLQRRVGASAQRLMGRLGRADPELLEFSEYLVRWDRSFWRGFYEAWRARAQG